MKLDLLVEYVAGFSCGLFIFQSLLMKSMMRGICQENVPKSFLHEFISIDFMMAAMAPLTSLLMMGRDMHAMQPGQLMFWGVLSLGIAAGFVLAYPVNVWRVAAEHKAMGSNEQGGMDAKPTTRQLTAVAGTPLLLLIAGIVAPANFIKHCCPARQQQ